MPERKHTWLERCLMLDNISIFPLDLSSQIPLVFKLLPTDFTIIFQVIFITSSYLHLKGRHKFNINVRRTQFWIPKCRFFCEILTAAFELSLSASSSGLEASHPRSVQDALSLEAKPAGIYFFTASLGLEIISVSFMFKFITMFSFYCWVHWEQKKNCLLTQNIQSQARLELKGEGGGWNTSSFSLLYNLWPLWRNCHNLN